MNIKPLLVRLQNAIGRDDLIEQMVLLPTSKISVSEETHPAKSVNLIVGYNSSPNSHTALDIALLTAHQTCLVTKSPVTVQVVYVMEDRSISGSAEVLPTEDVENSRANEQVPYYFLENSPLVEFDAGVTTKTKSQDNILYLPKEEKSVDRFAQAERILRQASSLAAEWKSSFKAHLRFGCVATELKRVVVSESADILFLGCNSIHHPIIQRLGSQFPCPVLGIPSLINDKPN